VIRVLIADDQELVRTGFRVILESEGDIEVVAEAENGLEAVRQAALVKPEVVLMDIRMPELDGLAATEQILRQRDPPTVVVLTTFDQNEYIYRALRAGAAGFLLKDAPSSNPPSRGAWWSGSRNRRRLRGSRSSWPSSPSASSTCCG
jgi:DNA-binding NarL/FixJ family response regulator